jgi:DNA-binding PadR family transcriptional regulator
MVSQISKQTLESIYAFFDAPQPRFMTKEEAVAFTCWYIREQDSYGTELMAYVDQKLSGWRLSDTILHQALKFLEEVGLVVRYQKGVDGRGRPRNMAKIATDLSPEMREHIDKFAELWVNCSQG